jgi:hypothetical protein
MVRAGRLAFGSAWNYVWESIEVGLWTQVRKIRCVALLDLWTAVTDTPGWKAWRVADPYRVARVPMRRWALQWYVSELL